MKRKVGKWLTFCMLSASLFAGSLLQSRASTVTGQTETVSANTTLSDNTVEVEKMNWQESMADDDLFIKNPLALTEEELEYCLNTYGDEDIAAWLSCLSENEQVELLEKSGRLSETLDYYGEDICRECGLVTGAHFADNMQYYKTIASCDKVGAASFSNTSGYYYIAFDGPQTGKATVKIGGIDKTKQISQRQTSMSTTVSGAKYNLKVTGGGTHTYHIVSQKEEALADVKTLKGGGKISYPHAIIRFSMTKPLGYALTVEPATDKNSSSRGLTYPINATDHADSAYKGVRYIKSASYSGDREYEKENTVNFEQHIYLPTNAGVGSTAITDPTKIHHMAFHFSVSPAEYKVVYDGNGGSSVPAGLNCKYDETAVYPAAPGNSPGYTITVNTNGAEGMVSPVTAFRSFLNWGDAGAVPGAAFRNLTTKMGQLLQNMRTGARQQFIRCLRSCIGNIQLPTIQTEEIANRL